MITKYHHVVKIFELIVFSGLMPAVESGVGIICSVGLAIVIKATKIRNPVLQVDGPAK